MQERFIRTERLLGKSAMDKLKNARVAVFGVGGVGGYVVEALVRSGIGEIDVFDNDTVAKSNLNRQIIALERTIGMAKVDVIKERALEINPQIKVNTHKVFYMPDNANEYDLSVYTYIIDAIDTVTAKIELIKRAKALGVPIISSMGTGNKIEASMLEVADIKKTQMCPLARTMRRELKSRGITELKVVYSKEQPIIPCDGDRTPASTAFVPGTAGLIIAGEVVKAITQNNNIEKGIEIMTKAEKFKEYIKGRNVTVIGIGISNMPLIKYLTSAGAFVTACDAHDAQWLGDNYKECEKLGVKLSLGDGYLDNLTDDLIFKTPGMRYDVPKLLEAKERGAVITSEMEVFFELCPSHIIAVTGSDGKTTTTSLIYRMMTDAGYKTWLGGNIGNPLLSQVDEMTENDYVILELSSFQLHTMKKSPEIAVITNLSPNHLDWHVDYAEYIDAKTNIFKHMPRSGKLVLNADNADSSALLPLAHCDVKMFSRKLNAYVRLENEKIICNNEEMLDINDIKIPGMHNVENYMAAIAAIYGLVSRDEIVSVAKNFGGVPHRIELVRTLNGVRYYNSSIDSSPNRTINTLNVFPQKVIMISGGKDKGIPYDAIGEPIADHVKTLILIGATSGKIEAALNSTGRQDEVKIIRTATYPEAVNTAYSEAKDGDVVLLSPASTSFDMFRNFEERGNLFKELVNKL